MITRSPVFLLVSTFALALGASAMDPAPAHARSSKVTTYRYQQIWPTAVRFLRIDAGFTILDKDVETGYVLFEASDEGKVFRGSLELVKLEDENGRQSVRMVLHIEDRPSYVESGLLDRLARKLRDEYGSPPEARPPDKDTE